MNFRGRESRNYKQKSPKENMRCKSLHGIIKIQTKSYLISLLVFNSIFKNSQSDDNIHCWRNDTELVLIKIDTFKYFFIKHTCLCTEHVIFIRSWSFMLDSVRNLWFSCWMLIHSLTYYCYLI